MGVKEKTPGILIAKNNKIATIIISLILIIAGIYLVINLTIMNFDLSNIETYIGPILLIISILMMLFFWKTTKLVLNKNQNTFTLSIKNLMKKMEQKGELSDIQDIRYTESAQFTNSGRGRGQRTIHKTVEMTLKNGETHILFQHSGSYNPLYNRTKKRAQKIADFLGLQLNIINASSALKNMGQAITNQFNPNQQQNMNQQNINQQQNNPNQQNQQQNNQFNN